MDNTPTALFDSYEADFKGLMESVKERLEGAGVGGTWTPRAVGCWASAALPLCRSVWYPSASSDGHSS